MSTKKAAAQKRLATVLRKGEPQLMAKLNEWIADAISS